MTGSIFKSSRFARKVLWLFLLCAILPIVAVSAHALINLNRTIDRQLQEDVERTARAVGQSTVERLQMAEQRLSRMSIVSSGSADEVFRKIQLLDVPPAHPRIQVVPGTADHHAGVRLVDNRAAMAIAGTLRDEVLESIGAPIPTESNFCLIEPQRRTVIHCSSYDWAEHLLELNLGDRAGVRNVELLDSTYTLAHWDLFLEPMFGVERWKVVAFRNRNQALSDFTFLRYFPLVVALALTVAAALSLMMLRRGLRPMQTLIDATERLSIQDFSKPVSIQSDDEFEQLGDAFNSMSSRLKKQFGRLELLSELDRRVLESDRASEITDWVLLNLTSVMDFQSACILLPPIDSEGAAKCVSNNGEKQPQARSYEGSIFADLMDVGARAHGPISEPLRRMPNLASLLNDYHNINELSVTKVVDGDVVFAFLVVGFADAAARSEAARSIVELRDRLAVAFSSLKREQALFQQAHFDQLTGLPNRLLFQDRLEQELSRAQHYDFRLAVLYLDLDRFKTVNDSLGHAAGDELLKQFAIRLKECLRESDTASRMGGDEYTILQAHISTDNDAATLAARIQTVLSEPFNIGDQKVSAGVSIGIAHYPEDGHNAEVLLRNADAAMYSAKEQGRSSVAYYSKRLSDRAKRRLVVETRLRRAVSENDFELRYQPQYSVAGNRLCGAEALVRIADNDKFELSPAEFIPLAEQTGLIQSIGTWVLQEAFMFQKSLRSAGLELGKLAINVSPLQLRNPHFAIQFKELARQHDADVSQIALEITETALADHVEVTQRTLTDLAALGTEIILDDFGTGHSSLRYLQQFPIHTLKLDRTFVANAVSIRQDRDLAGAIVQLAHRLGKPVIAEGVETEGQLELIRDLGCEMMQGYLRSKPITGEELIALLEPRKLRVVKP